MNLYLIILTSIALTGAGWWLWNMWKNEDVPQVTKIGSSVVLFVLFSFGVIYWTAGPGRGPTAEVTRAPTVQKTEAQVAAIKQIEAKPVVVKGPTKEEVKVEAATKEATTIRSQAQEQTVQEAALESNRLVEELINQSNQEDDHLKLGFDL